MAERRKRSFPRRIAGALRTLWRDFGVALEGIVRWWPGVLGYRIRAAYYRRRLKSMGRDVRIEPGVYLVGHRHISLGDRVHIDRGCIVSAGPPGPTQAEIRRVPNAAFGLAEGEVGIGKAAHVAVGVYILGHGGVQMGDFCGLAGGARVISYTNHYASFDDRSRRDVYFTVEAGSEHAVYLSSPVVLGNNVGVASNAVILPGVTMGDESFLTVGSVALLGAIPPNSIASGNPAVPLKKRFRDPRGGKDR